MKTRVRYVKNNEMLVSKEKFFTGTEFIYVEIIPNEGRGRVLGYSELEKEQEIVLMSFFSKNLQELKKVAKLELKKLGVNFNDEVRPGKHLKGDNHAERKQKETPKTQEVQS